MPHRPAPFDRGVTRLLPGDLRLISTVALGRLSGACPGFPAVRAAAPCGEHTRPGVPTHHDDEGSLLLVPMRGRDIRRLCGGPRRVSNQGASVVGAKPQGWRRFAALLSRDCHSVLDAPGDIGPDGANTAAWL